MIFMTSEYVFNHARRRMTSPRQTRDVLEGGGRHVGVHGIVYSVYVYVCKRLQGIRCMRIPVY